MDKLSRQNTQGVRVVLEMLGVSSVVYLYLNSSDTYIGFKTTLLVYVSVCV